MKQRILFLLTLFTLALLIGTPQQAQAQDYRVAKTLDTLSNTGTATWEPFTGTKSLLEKKVNVYGDFVHTQVSGTGALIAIRQETYDPGGTYWVNVDTITVGNATANIAVSKTTNALRTRWRFVGAGTGVHVVRAYLIGRKKEE